MCIRDRSKPLPIEDFDSMIDYNINDIESTSELLNRCKKDVDLRIAIEDEYGVRVLSKDGVNTVSYTHLDVYKRQH